MRDGSIQSDIHPLGPGVEAKRDNNKASGGTPNHQRQPGKEDSIHKGLTELDSVWEIRIKRQKVSASYTAASSQAPGVALGGESLQRPGNRVWRGMEMGRTDTFS